MERLTRVHLHHETDPVRERHRVRRVLGKVRREGVVCPQPVEAADDGRLFAFGREPARIQPAAGLLDQPREHHQAMQRAEVRWRQAPRRGYLLGEAHRF